MSNLSGRIHWKKLDKFDRQTKGKVHANLQYIVLDFSAAHICPHRTTPSVRTTSFRKKPPPCEGAYISDKAERAGVAISFSLGDSHVGLRPPRNDSERMAWQSPNCCDPPQSEIGDF